MLVPLCMERGLCFSSQLDKQGPQVSFERAVAWSTVVEPVRSWEHLGIQAGQAQMKVASNVSAARGLADSVFH